MPESITIYNTLTKTKEKLTTLTPGKIGIYACGVTVYDDCHIGHAMQAIFFDMIRNFLEHSGYEVTYVRNYTDVEDKIIKRATERKMSPKTLAEDMIKSSEEDMKSIGVKPATHEPKVSDHIDEIIDMIKILVANGSAYVTETGDVYYKVKEKKDYGKLSRRKVDDLKSGTRKISSSLKNNEHDFALWKQDETPDASWESPWGRGRPGWHIECSALSRKFLGNSFDIHGGGLDLVFPHHENEIAQSESANKAPYASVWLHSGLLTINHQKMSKSLGNQITIKDFVKKWDAEVLRLSFMQNHYLSNIDFSEQVFSTCRKRLYYYYQTLLELKNKSEGLSEEEKIAAIKLDRSLENSFKKSMCDNFNTPQVFAELNKFVKSANAELAKNKKNSQALFYNKLYQMKSLGQVLGLLQQEPKAFLENHKNSLLKELNLCAKEIEEKIKSRNEARQAKDWKLSDEVRDELAKKGIVLKDQVEGTTWSLKDTLDED